jgi:hypothetical protein
MIPVGRFKKLLILDDTNFDYLSVYLNVNSSASNMAQNGGDGSEDHWVIKRALFTCNSPIKAAKKHQGHQPLEKIGYRPNFDSPTLEMHIRQWP